MCVREYVSGFPNIIINVFLFFLLFSFSFYHVSIMSNHFVCVNMHVLWYEFNNDPLLDFYFSCIATVVLSGRSKSGKTIATQNGRVTVHIKLIDFKARVRH